MGARGPVDVGDPRFARRLAWRLWRRAVLGAVAAAVTAGIIAALSAPVFFREVPGQDVTGFLLTWTPPVFAVACVIGFFGTLLIVRSTARWAVERRPPDARDAHAFATLPRKGTILLGVEWVVGIALLIWIFDRTVGAGWPAVTIQSTLITLAYSGIQGMTLAYLLGEQIVRPVLAQILPADTDTWPRSIGVTTRLLIAWFVVSGGPLLILAFNFGRLNAAQRSIAGPSLVIGCLIIALVGVVVAAIAGRRITAPLDRLRAALKRVATGDLSVELVADEPGEIGLVQAGFNQMVEGLQERERMRDVFGRYVGAEVARRAMETEFGTGGERCEATVMFVDIIGSTGLTQRRDPDAVVAILNGFFDAVVQAVAAEGGLINKFQGDGALCLFGTPLPCEDHAARALRAARELSVALAPLGDIAAAIGVSSGEVVAGNVGAADRYEFTVIGDAVNEAARLTDQAKIGRSRVLVSERTIRAADAIGDGWVRGETLLLRGRSDPTVTYAPR